MSVQQVNLQPEYPHEKRIDSDIVLWRWLRMSGNLSISIENMHTRN